MAGAWSAVGAESGGAPTAFFVLRRRFVGDSSGGASGGMTGGDAVRASEAMSRRRMPCEERKAEIDAGVEFSVWAIHTSVLPCSTHWRISSRYGLSVAFCVMRAASLLGPLGRPAAPTAC